MNSQSKHWIAKVTTVRMAGIHFMAGGMDESGRRKRTALPIAHWIVLQEEPEGVYVFRYSDEGDFGGDTWKSSLDFAHKAVALEYEIWDRGWLEAPGDSATAIGLATKLEAES